jgi:hypothetical protein
MPCAEGDELIVALDSNGVQHWLGFNFEFGKLPLALVSGSTAGRKEKKVSWVAY